MRAPLARAGASYCAIIPRHPGWFAAEVDVVGAGLRAGAHPSS